MNARIFSLYHHPLASSASNALNIPLGKVTLRSFPDEESYLKVDSVVENQHAIIIDSFDKPNNKLLPLLFLANTLKSLGATHVGILTPYLSYMRQDKRFKDGEAISSKYFANIISKHFDWLITVDPHLHRYKALSDIYTISAHTLHASSLIANWIKKNITKPLLIGPDIESKQWVSTLAQELNAPYMTLIKTRFGDKSVKNTLPDVSKYKGNTPVLVDDIISTGQTMLETIKHLRAANMPKPVCVGIHAIFADKAYQSLVDATSNIITCNTICHPTNGIDLAPLVSHALTQQINE